MNNVNVIGKHKWNWSFKKKKRTRQNCMGRWGPDGSRRHTPLSACSAELTGRGRGRRAAAPSHALLWPWDEPDEENMRKEITEFQFSKKEQQTSSNTGKLTKANFGTRGPLPQTQNGPAAAQSLHRGVSRGRNNNLRHSGMKNSSTRNF